MSIIKLLSQEKQKTKRRSGTNQLFLYDLIGPN